jgi:hypothetical protein
MPSFGDKIVLRETVKNEPIVETKKEVVGDAPSRPTRAKVKPFATKKEEGNVVESVKNINDAVSYFMEKGVTVESKEQLEELMQKHNVVFPNMK